MACASRTPSSMRRARLNAVLGGPEMSEQSTAMTDDDEAPEPYPPTAERVARRALVLAAVTCRGSIESDAESEGFRRSVLTWFERTGLLEEAEAEERHLLAVPVGQLTHQRAVDASWRSEGLAVLAWALHCRDLARYDQQCEPEHVADSVGFMMDSPVVLNGPVLRSSDQLHRLAALMFSLHWRLRQFSLKADSMDFERFAGEAWFGPLEVDGLLFAEKDLAIHGVPVVRSARWRDVLSIARERQQAANWLAGHDPIYSEVGTDTQLSSRPTMG